MYDNDSPLNKPMQTNPFFNKSKIKNRYVLICKEKEFIPSIFQLKKLVLLCFIFNIIF